ncbi:MAG TPA: hypothetical protein VGN30_16985 [Steroidobacteraceae bacterium]
MNTVTKTLSLMALCCAACGPVLAQQQPAPPAATPAPTVAPDAAPAPRTPSVKADHATAQSEAGEPRAGTSTEPAAAPAPPPAPSTGTTPPSAGTSAARPAAGQKSAPRTDRLDLGTATVTGDREQPKVMYVVPWKRSDIGDLSGKPMNSLVDEILAPVDRDVFKREVVYYNAVQADTSQNGAPPKPAQQGEK